MQEQTRLQVQVRPNRIAGQVAGLQRMIEKDDYCVDLLTQVAAVRSALDAVGVTVLTDHLEGWVAGDGTGSEHAHAREMTREELVEEVRLPLKRFLR